MVTCAAPFDLMRPSPRAAWEFAAVGTLVRAICAAMFFVGLSPTVGFGQLEVDPPDLHSEAAQPQPDAARLRAEIADKLAKLGLPAHPAATPTVKAAKARKAIERGDFAVARQIVAAVLAGSRIQAWRFYPFEPFILAVPDVHSATFAKKMDDWVTQAAGDPIPLLVRARYYVNTAWNRRGPYFVSATPSDNLDAFADDMARALKDVDAAIKLDHANPYAYLLKLGILSDMGRSEEMKAWFTASAAAYPNFFPLYQFVLDGLTPKWGGSIAEMSGFVDDYAGPAPDQSPLKMLYLALYDHLLDDAGVTCSREANRDSEILAPCIGIRMKKIAPPHLDEQVQKALRLYEHHNHQEYDSILRAIHARALREQGSETFADAILQQAAIVTHSSTEMTRKAQGHNDYVIDQLAALTWYRQLLFDNAIGKMKEALRDLDGTTFADPGEKTEETADLYNQLATYSKLKAEYLARMRQRANLDDTYVDMIVYQTAAATLSKPTYDEHLACYGYAQLRLYEDAIRSCSEVLDDDDNIQAHYWRGIAYRWTKQLPQALRDLGTVADSNDGRLRTIAAIQMSYIYLGVKDYKSLLAVIDEHRSLFNPMWAGFAYETRCRAHLELGDLQKALDDCTAALQTTSSPQAQRLRQEVIERLANPKQNPMPEPAAAPPPAAVQPDDAAAGFPHLNPQVVDDIKVKIGKAGFAPNGIAVVYDIGDWHRQFTAAHPYAKMLDLPMPSLKEAVAVMARFAQDGLGFAARPDRPARFHVVLVDDRQRRPDDPVVDKHIWGTLGISVVQVRNVAEMQKLMDANKPDLIVIAAALPEPTKGDIRGKTAAIPSLTTAVPLAPDDDSTRGAEDPAYERASLGFEAAVFDALQRTIPAGHPVCVSFVTM